MTLKEASQHASPYLLCWINLTMDHISTLYDLKKIKRLEEKNFPGPYGGYSARKMASDCERDFLRFGDRDWSLLGELTNLQVLEFPKGTPVDIIDDFSFLPKLKNLRRLKLRYTDFADCSLLAGLTQLKYLSLPDRKKLIHAEVLDTLTCEIHTDDSVFTDRSFPKYKTLPIRRAPSPSLGSFAIRYLEYGKSTYTNGEITQKAVNKMAKSVQTEAVKTIFMSLDENGEEDFFTVDIDRGWAALTFNAWDEKGNPIFYIAINEKYAGVEDEAPVQIGRQSPVAKHFALDDLALAAECAVYFANTGKLYPAVQWAEFS